MIATLLQAFIELHPNWGIDREPMTEPARRHRCEICMRVFECHLCTIDHTHEIHTDHPKTLSETFMFICEVCCEVPNNRYQPRCNGRYITDMLTGDSKKEQERILCRLKLNPEPHKR